MPRNRIWGYFKVSKLLIQKSALPTSAGGTSALSRGRQMSWSRVSAPRGGWSPERSQQQHGRLSATGVRQRPRVLAAQTLKCLALALALALDSVPCQQHGTQVHRTKNLTVNEQVLTRNRRSQKPLKYAAAQGLKSNEVHLFWFLL